jgi:hypothetical protein
VTAPASPDPAPAPGQCLCGEHHDSHDPITTAHKARISAYLASHPGHQFAYDDTEDGGTICAVIIPPPDGHGPPAVIAAATSLPALLDAISAPPAPVLS